MHSKANETLAPQRLFVDALQMPDVRHLFKYVMSSASLFMRRNEPDNRIPDHPRLQLWKSISGQALFTCNWKSVGSLSGGP